MRRARSLRSAPVSFSRSLRLRSSLAALLALCSVACATASDVPRLPLGGSETAVEPGTFAGAPPDVLVATVRERGGAWDAPVEALRQALYRGMVDKLFSPVRLAVVDERAIDRRGDPALEADECLLVARLVRWDTSALDSRGRVDAEVQAELVSLAGDVRVTLWSTVLHRRLEVGARRARRATRAELGRELAQRLAQEILAELPPRGSL